MKPPKSPRSFNSTLPARTSRLASSKPMERGAMTRKRRTASEFARIYGSRERVRWIKDLPCLVCHAIGPIFGALSAGKSENCHTVTGGTGRKANADTIVPLCHSHHRRYDQHQAPFDTEEAREAMKAAARRIADRWDAMQRGAA